MTYLDNAARRRIRDPSKQARRNSTIIATRLSRDPTGLSTTNPLQWSVGVVIRIILGNCLATKGREGNKNSGRVKGKRKREGGRKKDKVVAECRHELSSGRRIPVISTTLSGKIVGRSGEARRASLTATKIISRERSGGRKGPRAFVNLAGGGGNAG